MVSRGSKSSLWELRWALHTKNKGLKTKSQPRVSLSIQSLRFFQAHIMMYVAPQHPFFPASQVFCMLQQFDFFHLHEVFQFSAKHTDATIMGASDIGQVSAYMRKLYKLPPGTSKCLLHFVQYKGSTKVIRYLFPRNYFQKAFSFWRNTHINCRCLSVKISKRGFISQKPSHGTITVDS